MQLQDIHKLVGGKLQMSGAVSLETDFRSVHSLRGASSSDISYVSHKKFLKSGAVSKAGLLLLEEGLELPGRSFIAVKNVQQVLILLLESLYPPVHHLSEVTSIQEKSSVTVHPDAVIYPGATISSNVSIAKDSVIYPGVFIGKGCKIGEGCTLHPNVVLYHECEVGNHVIIHAGSVIGSDGFGYLPQADGSRVKIPQVGNVVIEDDVEIGSNSSIDRAALDTTLIKRGTKIDNLVQVAHNVTVGEDNVLCSQVGISGSCTLGSSVILAGQVGLADHVEICNQVMIGAKSGVPSSVKTSGIYSGIPIMEQRLWRRAMGALKKLPEFMKHKANH